MTTHYVHRGLIKKNLKENSAESFRNSIKKGYGIETDLHITKDRQIVCFHDFNLKRKFKLNKQIKKTNYDFLKKPMREYEPRSAYMSGKDGLSDYKVLAPDIKRLLTPKGQVFLEADASRKYLITDVFKKHNFTLTHEFDTTINAFLTLRYSDVSATADKRHNNPTDVSATADSRHNSPTNK